MSWRKIIFVVIALIVLLGGSAALSWLFVSMKPEPPRGPDLNLKRYVNAVPVTYNEIISPLKREGRVVSGSDVILVSEASGKIENGAAPLRKGTTFKKGQLLATIYKDEAELALKARKSQFLNAFTNILPDMKVDFPADYQTYLDYFNKIDLKRSLPSLPDPESEKLKIFLASRSILNEYYGILQDEKNLERRSLYAPFKGTISEVNFEVGAYVNAGSQIARLIRTDMLEIEVPVENGNSKWIRIGDQVTVLSGFSDRALTGTVVRKADFVEAATQSRSIFVRVQNFSEDDLLAGEYKVVEFPGQKIANAMEIPRSAVFNSNEVFTVTDGKLKKAEINILKINETTLLFNGLDEGNMVVSESLINVKENLPVEILGQAGKPDQQTRRN
ncbi:efflux RND transporter periplasmic adaptor subunit [Gaoshiqia sp. Z1-71]|uniref:efflux RND transporter periplasmic adaptor subunit n=1 Tax=Gaoshiqia hydrogeniformans TaxID=3290090 RepID=UPI003BF8F396